MAPHFSPPSRKDTKNREQKGRKGDSTAVVSQEEWRTTPQVDE
jgi:hypothetical protein